MFTVPRQAARPRPSRPVSDSLRTMAWALASCAIVLGVLGGGGREGRQTYSRGTRDEVVASALAMVKNNDAKRLADLIYAEGPEMRSVLNRLGNLFGRLQDLAAQIQLRMPHEVAELKAQGVSAAADSVPLGAFLEEV